MAASGGSGTSSKSEFTVGGKYRLVRKIGSGSFGDIYLGVNVTNGEVRNWVIVTLCLQLVCLCHSSGGGCEVGVTQSPPSSIAL